MSRRRLKTQTVQQLTTAWANGYGGSMAAITFGVNNPSRDPTAAAIAAQTTMVQNWNTSVSSGQWASALQKAGLAGWQAGMFKKTIPNLANNAAAGAAHYQAFMQAWAPAVTQMVAALPPRGTYQQNKARSAAMLDAMHLVKGKYRKLWRGGA